MKQGNRKRISSWEKVNGKEVNYIGRKIADYSIFNSFIINIPLSYKEKILRNIYMEQNIREKIKIKILCNNEVFDSILVLPRYAAGKHSIAIVYNENLQSLFRRSLSKSYAYTTEYYNKFNKKLFNIPRKYSEYIDFYVGDSKNTFILKLISREEINIEEEHTSNFEKQKKIEELKRFKEEVLGEDNKVSMNIPIQDLNLNSNNINKEELPKLNGKENDEEIKWKLGSTSDRDFQNIKYNYLRDKEVAIGEEYEQIIQTNEINEEKFDFNELTKNVYKVVNSLKEVYAKEICDYILTSNKLTEEKAYLELEKELLNMRSKKYERDLVAREKCLGKYGVTCSCCGVNLEKIYGNENQGNIEVHYIKHGENMDGRNIFNPYEDLRPVCANCHSIIHSRIPAYSIEEVKEKINWNK